MNKALTELGVNPARVPADLRQRVQRDAIAAGASPQEAAAFILFQIPASERPWEAEPRLDAWVSKKKRRDSKF